MTRARFTDLDLSSSAWPVHLPPVGFADVVLDRAGDVYARGAQPRTKEWRVSLRQRWSWAIAAALLGIGATAAAYRFAGGVTQPEPKGVEVTSLAAPRFTPAPLVPAINSAVSEPERALPIVRRVPVSSASPLPLELPTLEPSAPVPHYPPCHCGPGAVVCSCVE